jgi:hypothetical protein
VNKENAKDYLPLVQALADGKTLQLKVCDDSWQDFSNTDFCNPAIYYRIKPKPREWWVVLTSTGSPVDVYQCRATAESASAGVTPARTIVQVKEVL